MCVYNKMNYAENYHTVENQNRQLENEIQKIKEEETMNDKKTFYSNQTVFYYKSLNYFLFFVYYILIAILLYFIFFLPKMDIFLKISFFIIFISYPFFVKPFQIFLWKYVFSFFIMQ